MNVNISDQVRDTEQFTVFRKWHMFDMHQKIILNGICICLFLEYGYIYLGSIDIYIRIQGNQKTLEGILLLFLVLVKMFSLIILPEIRKDASHSLL